MWSGGGGGGLTLLVADNKTGYFGVHLDRRSQSKPYTAQVTRGCKQVHLGNFTTAEEAALCVARSAEEQKAAARASAMAAMASAAPPPQQPASQEHLERVQKHQQREQRAAERAPAPAPLTSEEALQQAQAEGLTLRVGRSDNKTSYLGVCLANPGTPKPYQASVWRGGKNVHLGSFATAEEAALCVARSPEGQAAAAERRHR